jgi:heat-inducible transcriptional repressor
MDERQELILETIIKEHVATGVPVSSSVLVGKYRLDISSATVRNEMAVLEKDGYIVQPHTSAGRVPTEKAYKWFISRLKAEKVSNTEAQTLSHVEEKDFKKVAKTMAEVSGLAVFWALPQQNVYYTGFGNLLSRPELIQAQLLSDFSEVIDSLDEIINDYFDNIQSTPAILVGSDGPFGNFCSTIVVKYSVDGHEGVFGVLGPLRLDYAKNLALVKFVKDNLCQK